MSINHPPRTQVGDAIPWPVFGDGARYIAPQWVRLPDGREGTVVFITWVDADGRYVNRADKNAAKKGARWDATVALPDGSARLPLGDLTPAQAGAA